MPLGRHTTTTFPRYKAGKQPGITAMRVPAAAQITRIRTPAGPSEPDRTSTQIGGSACLFC